MKEKEETNYTAAALDPVRKTRRNQSSHSNLAEKIQL